MKFIELLRGSFSKTSNTFKSLLGYRMPRNFRKYVPKRRGLSLTCRLLFSLLENFHISFFSCLVIQIGSVSTATVSGSVVVRSSGKY